MTRKPAKLRRDFKLTVNGQVKAVEALPNNRLAVGGAFTLVNGKKHESFVVVDATTGEIAPEWAQVRVEDRILTEPMMVKTIHRQGDYVYIGGTFTHVYESEKAVLRIHAILPVLSWANLLTACPDCEYRP